MARGSRKERRTFSLDPELLKYIEKVRQERRIDSASAALEQILRESQLQQERRRQEDRIAKYYSSLSDGERNAEVEWGEFSETQFPVE